MRSQAPSQINLLVLFSLIHHIIMLYRMQTYLIFFVVWLKRTLSDYSPLMSQLDPETALAPKEQELCEMARWDPTRYSHKDQKFFEYGMFRAFTESRRILMKNGIGSVVFAHKTTEGWEALLSGMIRGGWIISGSWPIATENGDSSPCSGIRRPRHQCSSHLPSPAR